MKPHASLLLGLGLVGAAAGGLYFWKKKQDEKKEPVKDIVLEKASPAMVTRMLRTSVPMRARSLATQRIVAPSALSSPSTGYAVLRGYPTTEAMEELGGWVGPVGQYDSE